MGPPEQANGYGAPAMNTPDEDPYGGPAEENDEMQPEQAAQNEYGPGSGGFAPETGVNPYLSAPGQPEQNMAPGPDSNQQSPDDEEAIDE
jgi:hypothetical protein